MKKILFIAFGLFAMSSFAQDSKPKSLDCYVAGSVSMPSGNNFKQDAYPSLEVGVCKKNFMFGLSSGRLNFDTSPYGKEKADNYYYELKTYASFPIGEIKGFVVAGWGQVFNSNHTFIEYGGGLVYSIKKVDLIVQVSSWDGKVYLSPGIAYNFSL